MTQVIEISVAVLIIASRVMSHFEHKGTKKDVSEIKIFINGEMEKRLEKAREEGRQEVLNKKNKKK